MKKVLFGTVIGLMAGIGVYIYAKKKAENKIDIVIDVDATEE